MTRLDKVLQHFSVIYVEGHTKPLLFLHRFIPFLG